MMNVLHAIASQVHSVTCSLKDKVRKKQNAKKHSFAVLHCAAECLNSGYLI